MGPGFRFVLHSSWADELVEIGVFYYVETVFRYIHANILYTRMCPSKELERHIASLHLYPARRRAAVFSKTHSYKPLVSGGKGGEMSDGA